MPSSGEENLDGLWSAQQEKATGNGLLAAVQETAFILAKSLPSEAAQRLLDFPEVGLVCQIRGRFNLCSTQCV